jgi:transcriptional regulator with XRE-family HTH domain
MKKVVSMLKGIKPKVNEVDLYVGSRLRLKRTLAGFTQETLAESLGVTPQQVQKYENGSNRMGASRLLHVSHILQVPVQFFFEGLNAIDTQLENGSRETFSNNGSHTPITSEIIELIRYFSKINDAQVRQHLLKLIKALAESSN